DSGIERRREHPPAGARNEARQGGDRASARRGLRFISGAACHGGQASGRLLDEPFQGLAPALALEYARTLGELRKHRPELALLITESSPALLDRVADRTLQIERGEVLPPTRQAKAHVLAV